MRHPIRRHDAVSDRAWHLPYSAPGLTMAIHHASGVKWSLGVTENRKPFYRPAMYPWCWGTTPCCLKVILTARFFLYAIYPHRGTHVVPGTRDRERHKWLLNTEELPPYARRWPHVLHMHACRQYFHTGFGLGSHTDSTWTIRGVSCSLGRVRVGVRVQTLQQHSSYSP